MRITDQDGTTITTQNDLLGRKTGYSDPDMGTWEYTYDDNSRLTSQVDAKGQAPYTNNNWASTLVEE
jgi:YD repeat-containing protein